MAGKDAQNSMLDEYTVIGAYTIIEKMLSEGLACNIYKAEHKDIPNEYVAIKILKKQYVTDSAMKGQFLEEARILYALRKESGIIIFCQLDYVDMCPYIAMDYAAAKGLWNIREENAKEDKLQLSPALAGKPQPLPQVLSGTSNVIPSTSRSTAFSRRTFFERIFFRTVNAFTLGFLGVSWLELGPKVPQFFAPAQQFVPSTKPFGFIFHIFRGHKQNVNGLAWSVDGKRIASASFDRTLQVWNAIDGSNLMILSGHTAPITDVAWSPDGEHITSCSVDRTVRIWDASNGQMNLSIMQRHKDVVNAVAWSPDGNRIASASFDKTVIVWGAASGEYLSIYTGHKGPVYGVAWSPDSKFIASCSGHINNVDIEHEVHIWEVASQKLIYRYTGHAEAVLSVSWQPKGDLIASGSQDATVHVWSIDTTTALIKDVVLRTFDSGVSEVSWSSNGKYIAASTHFENAHVWKARASSDIVGSPYNEQPPRILGTRVTGVSVPENTENLATVAWSPNGTMIASGGGDSSVQVWATGLTDAGM